MTTAKTPQSSRFFRMPDPERRPEDMTSFNHLTITGNAYHLSQHLGNPGATLVAGEHYLTPLRTRELTGVRYPDLLVAFNVNPAAYYRSNAYIIEEQGKPPDFVLEIASPSTRSQDTGEKRDWYADLGIPEYWRFDESIQRPQQRLAGDSLADGQYLPIPIEQVADGVLQGYSQVLNLNLRWEHGQLRWHDPATGRHIVTLNDERARADQAEARVQELEEELRQLRAD